MEIDSLYFHKWLILIGYVLYPRIFFYYFVDGTVINLYLLGEQ